VSDFDKTAFEQLMGEAVQQHGQQQYEAALALSTQAYEIAPDNSFEKGRAARDNSARYDRLGQQEEAETWARVAYTVHDGLVTGMQRPTREAFRERSVSAMYVGVNGLRKVFAARKAGIQTENPEALAAMRQTWSDLKAAKSQAQGINRKVDQYEVNAARRVSMAESLIGSKKAGIAIGVRAVALAFWSESPRLDTANPNLTSRQRLQAKTKALLGGVAALGTGLLSIPRINQSQQLATTIAAKTL
jgi:hypothetical protein